MANTSVTLWRYNKICEFGHYGIVQNDNGTYSENDETFISDFKRHCADYYITPEMSQSLQGLDIKQTRAIAVRQLRNDKLEQLDSYNYYVRLGDGNIYNIESIKFNTMSLMGKIVIVLSRTDKS